jgi:hypothetical protein
MPAILSHHLFGRSVLLASKGKAYTSRDERDAFLLGNQGPDPLYYGTLSPHVVGIKTLGARMHTLHVEQTIEFMRDLCSSAPLAEQKILDAYLCGWLCHFVLDSSTHPLIFAYEQALTHAGVPGLDAGSRSFVHAQIEADLDVYLLYRLTGRTVGEYYIPKQVLYSNAAALALIDRLYAAVAREIYGIKVPHDVFSLSVRDMRKIIRLLFSPGGTKRHLVGRIERLARPHSLLQALSHRTKAYEDCWYANDEHCTWLHPATGASSIASYFELFEDACAGAQRAIELFEHGAPGAAITGGLDFDGNARMPQ